ncbi:MAG: site-specific integrase [Rickettsiales bacterium]|jgi:integrase|nr:site-specific integrase [Rickettsiales bacterium]
MAKYDANFQLKSPKSTGKTVIRLRMGFDYVDFTWELNDSLNRKLKIYPKLWDFKNQCPISKSKIPAKFQNEIYNLQVIGQTIDKVKVVVNKIINDAALNEIKITNDYLKQELLIRLDLKKKSKEMSVYDYTIVIIKEMEEGILLIEKSDKRYEGGTIKQYRVLSTILEAKYPNTTFSEIDKDWYEGFKSFLMNKQEFTYKNKEGNEEIFTKKKLRNSSIGNYIKNLRYIMKLAFNRNVSKNMNHKADWFLKPNAQPSGKTEIYLTEQEIRKIYDFQPQKDVLIKGSKVSTETLKKAKDLFLLGCYTGLRVSDYNRRLSKNNFTVSEKGTKILVKPTKKTGNKVHIPIYWEELILLAEKYNYEFPKMSDQKVNEYIKLVCKEINGFDEIISYYDIVGGIKELFEFPKWQLITTHTGRRSAATNLSKYGLTEGEIAKFTGHKTNSTVARYNKSSTTDTADMLMEKLNRNKNQKNATQ